jgi:hypothetical protein
MTTTEAEERVIISAQVPAAVRDELARHARQEDRTLSAEVRRILTWHSVFLVWEPSSRRRERRLGL